jgi:hypothetical protein
MPATRAGINGGVVGADSPRRFPFNQATRVGPIARTGTSVRTGFALSRSPFNDGTCECAASPGMPAKITGAQTIPMAKIVGPIILGMA